LAEIIAGYKQFLSGKVPYFSRTTQISSANISINANNTGYAAGAMMILLMIVFIRVQI
jgi:hypothetical protein